LFFVLFELLVAIAAFFGITAGIMELSSTLWKNYQKRVAEERFQALKKSLETFYKDNAMAVNSRLVSDTTIMTRVGTRPSGRIRLPDGRILGSYLREKPISVASALPGLLYFKEESQLIDEGGAPFRIYITPLQEDPQGRFAYRDIYLINAKGRTAVVGSYPNCTLQPSGYYRCEFNCAPDEECAKIDGYKITLELYRKTLSEIEKTARRIQTYAQQLYAQDPQKDVLRYYLSHESTNNKNDLNCSSGTVDCCFSHLSEIRNSSLYNRVSSYRESFNGYTVYWTPPAGSRLAYASSIPFLTLRQTPFRARLYYDNSSRLIRNPQTVSNYAGYTMLLFTPVDDVHGITYYVGQ